MSLGSAGLEVLLLMAEILPTEDTIILLKWKFRLPPGHFGLLMSLNQQAKKGVTVLPGVIDPDYEGKIQLLLNKGVKRSTSGIQVKFCVVTEVNGKQFKQDSGLYPSKSKIWITPLSEKTVISWSIYWGQKEYKEGKGKSSYQYQLWSHDQLQKQEQIE